MTQTTETLGTALPALIAKCESLLHLYRSLQHTAPGCSFVIFNLERDIAAAKASITAGDVVAQMRAYTALATYKQ